MDVEICMAAVQPGRAAGSRWTVETPMRPQAVRKGLALFVDPSAGGPDPGGRRPR